jgi:DUF4097 and DUF4098 domain-containing protein YvlB
MHKTFHTPGPTSLYVELDSGQVVIRATETDETHVDVEGKDAQDATVEQRGDQVVVIAPERRGGFLGFGSNLNVTVSLPHGSDLAAKLGSADLEVTGSLGSTRVKSGSGEVRLDRLTQDAVVKCGSGHVQVTSSSGDLRVKTGSGHVQMGRTEGTVVVATGSGRVGLDDSAAEAVVKTGSGDVVVGSAGADVSMTSGSGDLEVASVVRGAVTAKTASGTVVVGVVGGVPVWTDISSVTGHVRSNLVGAGQPEEGQDHIEIRASTVSGDVVLNQL